MKTAMQELIEFVKDERFAHSNYTIELKAIELLPKEKEQIISAYNDGVNDGNTQGLQGKEGNGNYATLEEYYNQTYNHLHIVTDGKVGLSNLDETINNELNVNQNK
jgi:hypothetical protein